MTQEEKEIIVRILQDIDELKKSIAEIKKSIVEIRSNSNINNEIKDINPYDTGLAEPAIFKKYKNKYKEK